jgi:hypothetical protein
MTRNGWLKTAAGIFAASVAFGQPAEAKDGHPAAAAPHRTSPYHPTGAPDSAKPYYQSLWGVDNLLVRSTASGNLIRFSYRVVDPARARGLNDERASPRLIDPKHGLALRIPSLENVGLLRQRGEPSAGKEYSMVFSNKGFPVKPGDRVNVIIGDFHAEGLVVE